MDIDQFWSIVAASRARLRRDRANGNMDRQSEALRSLLKNLPPEDVVAFRDHMVDRVVGAYSWDLWGAAYVIQGGCSDDGFEYFRRWLVSMGRQVYEDALADPESLATAAFGPGVEDVSFEEFADIPYDVYAEMTGRDMPTYRVSDPPTPRGEEWSEEGDDLERRFPKLWQRAHTSASRGWLAMLWRLVRAIISTVIGRT